MNKVLFTIRFILLNILIILFYLVLKKIEVQGLAIPLFILFLGIYYIQTLKDLVVKNDFKFNKKYNIFSSIIIITMIIILLRVLYDPHFIYNNQEFLKQYDIYEKTLYGLVDNHQVFKEQLSYYVMNNAVFFNIFILLLFLYRKINRKKKKINLLSF